MFVSDAAMSIYALSGKDEAHDSSRGLAFLACNAPVGSTQVLYLMGRAKDADAIANTSWK